MAVTKQKILQLHRRQNLGLSVSIVVLVVAMFVWHPDFLTSMNMEVLAMGFVLEAFMALGMTLVIVTGGIDISVGAVLPFTAILTGILLRSGAGIPTSIAAGLLAAAIVGALNGTIINILRVHPFIVTLAMMLVLRGMNLVITGGAPVSGFPQGFAVIGQGQLFGVPVPLLLFGVTAIALGYALKNHRYLQQAYFIGGNARAARLSGIRVERFQVFVYALSALLAGVAGVIAASQYVSASNGFGQNAELRVITAAVIGGASLSGGRGSIGGTTLGVVFLAIIYNAFAMSGVSTYWQDVVTGAMLLMAVLLGEYLRLQKVPVHH